MLSPAQEKSETVKQDNSSKISRNKLAYLIIAFNQGLASISELAVSYFFKDALKIEPAKLSQIMSFISIPWMIKPIFGLITDLLPMCGYRRKVYIILCGLLNVLCWTCMATMNQDVSSATALLLLINLGLSFSTVVGEAIVVELSQLSKEDSSKTKDYVSLFFFCKYVGALFSAYMKGLLVEKMNIRGVFLIASILPWLLVISGLVLMEDSIKKSTHSTYGTIGSQETNAETSPSNSSDTSHSLIKEFCEFMCKKYVIIPTIFIIVFMATPSYNDPFFYFLTDELKFTPTDLGKISFFSTLATLIAIWMYQQYFKSCNFKMMITIGSILSFIFSFCGYILVLRFNLKLGISDYLLVLVSNSFLSMLGELILMPMLALAAQLCPKNLEGTVYSLFMSALNFGGILSGLNGSFLTTMLGITSKDYSNLYLLILISNIVSLAPLPMLCCIDNSYFQPEFETPCKQEDPEQHNLLPVIEPDSQKKNEKEKEITSEETKDSKEQV
jgi:folate/biopterin transporter